MKKTITLLIFVLLIIQFLTVSSESIDNDVEKLGFPSYFSWQDIDGVDYTTPIKDQSPAPTCEAYALVASLETLMQYQIGYPEVILISGISIGAFSLISALFVLRSKSKFIQIKKVSA